MTLNIKSYFFFNCLLSRQWKKKRLKQSWNKNSKHKYKLVFLLLVRPSWHCATTWPAAILPCLSHFAPSDNPHFRFYPGNENFFDQYYGACWWCCRSICWYRYIIGSLIHTLFVVSECLDCWRTGRYGPSTILSSWRSRTTRSSARSTGSQSSS